MTAPQKPAEAAPGGMRGSSRMHDPSEAEHDQRRRLLMNIAFVVIALLNATQLYWHGLHRWEFLRALCLVIAAVPFGLAVKAFELQFKMAGEECWRMLGEIPRSQKLQFALYSVLAVIAFGLQLPLATWGLWGLWGYDFVTYYHDRPERLRHLYAVAKTLDELRAFPVAWVWALPALVAGLLAAWP